MSNPINWANYDAARLMIGEQVAVSYNELEGRISTFEKYLSKDCIIVAGYGSKGRQIAAFLSSACGKDVMVYDQSPDSRDLAIADGYEAYSRIDNLPVNGVGVVLAACQDQLGQSLQFKEKFYPVFYEETAFFFNKPFHGHGTQEFPKWIVQNVDALANVFVEMPAREQQNFLDNINFRASLNPQKLGTHRRPVEDMWFDVPEQYGGKQYRRFLDVGAYDGDTLKGALTRLGVLEAVAVEANGELAGQISSLQPSFINLELLQVAAWSHSCFLEFSEDAAGMVTVDEVGAGRLRAEPLDKIVGGSIDILKMDIEGAELRALAGSQRILSTHPDLAIAAYHRPSDIVDIFEVARGAGYKVSTGCYMRHYSDCLDDTIYYFLK